ncbi:hypothetical protein TNCV_4038461 [Trichonephila clavipes]|nr:hypothetical protein TNCV_4038461 [Trichonephila clavipes]
MLHRQPWINSVEVSRKSLITFISDVNIFLLRDARSRFETLSIQLFGHARTKKNRYMKSKVLEFVFNPVNALPETSFLCPKKVDQR